MTGRDQTQTASRTCPECDAAIEDQNRNYDSDSGLRVLHCIACDTTAVEEGVGARMDRVANGESLDEIHDNLPAGLRDTVQDALPNSVEDTTVRYIDTEGTEVQVNTAEIVERPTNDSCAFPGCPETDDLQLKQETGQLCPTHYKVLTTDMGDPDARADLREETAANDGNKWSPEE